MKTKITCSWLENMAFESEVSGHRIVMDADESVGGEDRGPRPKPLVLSALAGCTGMDVISILKKMTIEPSFFNIDVQASASDEHPMAYERIHIVYKFKQDDGLDDEKVRKAVDLSQERYCAVSAMLRQAAETTFEIKYV